MCECDILCVSEDRSVPGAWALLRGEKPGSERGSLCSRVYCDLGVRFQPEEGGGSLTSTSRVP